MKIVEKKDNKLTFIIESDESLLNSIRRSVNQIPILAVDDIEISKNDSPLYDETIAHRIGLIPLKNQGKDGGKLKLNMKKEGMVYSEELKGDIKTIYDKIPITLLDKGQELELVATVKTGTGSEHSKFSPGLIFYRNVFELKIDKNCPKEVVEKCPKNILKLQDGRIIVDEDFKCDSCEVCVDFCKKNNKDTIEIVPTKELLVTIESFGQLSVEEIFKKSIETLKKDLAEFSKKLSK
ncbi:DNA-directed RNA polymerase subunit D [Candidatus Pacearchaeota archaeon]|nr:DNA-directed RNA polymerase subunit D [Candidatus Pacearchaeota archaeon]